MPSNVSPRASATDRQVFPVKEGLRFRGDLDALLRLCQAERPPSLHPHAMDDWKWRRGNPGSLFRLLLVQRARGMLRPGDIALAERSKDGWTLQGTPIVGAREHRPRWEALVRRETTAEGDVVVVPEEVRRHLPLRLTTLALNSRSDRYPLDVWLALVPPTAVWAPEIDPRPHLRRLGRGQRELLSAQEDATSSRRLFKFAVAEASAAGVPAADLARILDTTAGRVRQIRHEASQLRGCESYVLPAAHERARGAADLDLYRRRVERAARHAADREATVASLTTRRDDAIAVALERGASQSQVASWLGITQQRVSQLTSRPPVHRLERRPTKDGSRLHWRNAAAECARRR